MAPESLAAAYPDFDSVLDLIRRMRDMPLLIMVEKHLRLARYSPGRIEFEPTADAPRDMAARLAERLRGWTGGQRWAVSVVNEGGAATVAELRAEAEAEALVRAGSHPVVQAALAAFPKARILSARRVEKPPAEEVPAETAGAVHDTGAGPVAAADEWDPFEDEE